MKKVSIGDVCEINPSKRIPVAPDALISFVPMESVSINGKLDPSRMIEYGKTKNYSVFQNGDVLFAKITPCMENGKCAIAHDLLNGYGAGSTEFIVLRPDDKTIFSEYLYHFIHQELFRSNCRQNMTGSAGQKRVPIKYLSNYTIPVPPLAEQERIVAKIEELFSQLDAAVAELKKAKEKLNIYRQAVLKKAFSQYASKDIELKEYIENPQYGTSKKCDYYSGEQYTAVYRIPNIDFRNGRISHSDIKKALFTEEELSSLQLHEGDILVIRSNGSLNLVGRASIISEPDINGVFAGYLIRIRIKRGKDLSPKYLLYALSTHEARSYIERTAKSTSGINNINSKELLKLKIPVCSPEKQQRVVSIIESDLPLLDTISNSVEKALQQASSLRQTILKLAFEGKL